MNNFQNLTTTKLGNVGEKYITEFAKSKGAKPYIPAFDASFPVDSLCLKNGKVFSIEVKSKPRFQHYQITGYDLKDHQEYISLDFPVYVLFCDYVSKQIYGAWAKELDKMEKSYFTGGVVAFPLSAMTIYRGLSNIEVEELKKYNQSKYWA
jgi:hypothetical protein